MSRSTLPCAVFTLRREEKSQRHHGTVHYRDANCTRIPYIASYHQHNAAGYHPRLMERMKNSAIQLVCIREMRESNQFQNARQGRPDECLFLPL